MSEKHGIYSGVVDIARNGVDEVIRLRALNTELADALQSVIAWMDAPDESAFSDTQLVAARAALAKVGGDAIRSRA